MNLADPVIVVPGITASYLRDEYPIPAEYVWKVVRKSYQRVTLHPDNLDYEAIEPARVRADQLFEVAYEEFIEELRYNLSPSLDRPVPVFPFIYDWRKPLEKIEDSLAAFVEEVVGRTKLLGHYHTAGYAKNPRVNLVGHSMGGLIITGYLAAAGGKAPINKVVTLATPYQGSYEAVIQVTTGTGNLGTKAPSSRERDAARVTPALYHLLPSFGGAVSAPPGTPKSLFNPKAWQPTIVDSIAEFIRLSGLPLDGRRKKSERQKEAAALFGKMLSAAKKHRTRIDNFQLPNAGMQPRDWLAVIGTGATTRVRLNVEIRNGAPHFLLSSKDRQDQWSNANPVKARQTGDGTVPLEGAIPKFLDQSELVCVTPDDYGYWEIEDKVLTKVSGFHGLLPNMNMLHRLIVRFFTGASDRRGNTWGYPVPGVEKWSPPLKLKPKKREIK